MSISKFPQKPNEESVKTVTGPLQDLPPEVLAELSESYKKGNETQTEIDTLNWLKEIFAETKAPTTMDEIIVMLYRTKKVLIRRGNLSAKLHNLVKKGKIIRPTSRTFYLADD